MEEKPLYNGPKSEVADKFWLAVNDRLTREGEPLMDGIQSLCITRALQSLLDQNILSQVVEEKEVP